MVFGFDGHIVYADRKIASAIPLSSRKWHHIVISDGAHGRNHVDIQWKRDPMALHCGDERFHLSIGF